MKSSIDVKFGKSISFTPQFVHSISELVQDFSRRAISEAVTDAGKNSSQITSAQDAINLYEATYSTSPDYSLQSLSRELKQIEEHRWTAHLKDKTIFHELNENQILNLPNSPSQKIVSISVKNGSHTYSIQIDFSNSKFIGGTSFSIRGPFELVHHYNYNLSQKIASVTDVWSWASDFRFMIFLFTLSMFTFISSIPLIQFFYRKFFLENTNTVSYFLYICLSTLCIYLLLSLLFIIVGFWGWLFPLVDFELGGGVQRARVRHRVRGFIFGVIPFMCLLIPMAVSLISKKP